MRLAGIGLAAERLGAEINRTVAAASTALRIARNAAAHGAVPDVVERCLEQLESQIWLLSEQLDAVEPLYAASARAVAEPLDVRSIVHHVATIFTHRLREASVRFVLEAREPLTVHMVRAHLLQVLLHLFDNALYWLRRSPQPRHPEIRVRLLSDPPGMIFADNGPGVRAELREHIFRPFFSGRGDGRGLGLYLARAIMNRYGFSIELLDEPRLLAGANFRVLFAKE